MKRGLIFISILALALMACTGIQSTKLSVCDQVPTGQTSTLCAVSKKIGLPLENIGLTLELANIGALAGKAYTAQQADQLFASVGEELKQMESTNATTFEIFQQYLLARYAGLDPSVQAIFILLKDSGLQIPVPELGGVLLQPYDYRLLQSHIAKQRAILIPYLVAK